jgi:hypothetical protein
MIWQLNILAEQIMGSMFALGLFVLPLIASTTVCALMWLLTLPFGYLLAPGGLNLGLLWVAALIVGFPACFLETIICGPLILRADPKRSMTRFCAGVGAALGIFFYALVAGAAESIRVGSPPPTTDSRTITWIIFITVGMSGMISGGIFAVLAGATVPPKVPPVGDLDEI